MGRRRLTWAFLWFLNANWFLNVVRAHLGVSAMEVKGEALNDVMFGVLNAVAALPAIVAAVAWWRGLKCATSDTDD